MVIHEYGSVDHSGLHFAETVSLKLLKDGLDREQELSSGGEKLAWRECKQKTEWGKHHSFVNLAS